ncbi:hypothetical protein V5N11_033125 [Cardamine amara subsp. amara]|uniref:Uncharacterized protein n=1 Tax=Cardamine amara subsp. amara TaxID=228776 RepID=A0ABD1BLQ5_CARAN
MMNPLVLVMEKAGVLHDSEGQVRNAQGHKLDAEGNTIVEVVVGVDRHPSGGVDRDQGNDGGAHGNNGVGAGDHERILAEYNRPDQFYANRSAIRPLTFQRNDFELKP